MKLMNWVVIVALSILASLPIHAVEPTDYAQVTYSQPLLNGPYDANITPVNQLLGFEPGRRVAAPSEIESALLTWAKQSNRLKVEAYAKSHEGRSLYAVYISSPENLARLPKVQENIQRLANPINLSQSQANSIIKELPAVAWMAYSIHGNETSGADAALLAIYHLIASESAEITDLLSKQVIIIDPMMNPDGRARFSKELQEYRAVAPNVDDQSLLHTGSWPFGRTNHYFFDLNRDFIYATQPETRGRIKLINDWYPQIMIDGHEMGAQDTFLFAPAREPVNPHLPKQRKHWGKVFAADQARAFDAQGWRYYTGEWFENLYPGYSNYAEYRGSVHILYEQARIAEDGVARPDGRVITYQESVHHQLLSTMTNLETLSKHSQSLYQEFFKERVQNLSDKGNYANRSFAILPTDNKSREAALIDNLRIQNIQMYRLQKELTRVAYDQFSQRKEQYRLPKGTLIIPNRQAEARLLATMLEFDVAIKPEVYQEERHRTLRDGSSLMYDTTAWNLTMMYGLPAVMVVGHMDKHLEPITSESLLNEAVDPSAIAFAVNGEDDSSVSFAARAMELGFQVRVIDKATQLGEVSLSRGSVLVAKSDNPNQPELPEKLVTLANQAQLKLNSISTGHGIGDLPDWGGSHFQLLARPKIATLSRGSFSPYDVGATWYSLDTHLGIRHSLIDAGMISYADLRRYNVLVMPDQYGDSLSESDYATIKQWVEQGGTLIALADSTRALINHGLSKAKLLPEALDDAQAFDSQLQREWMSQNVPNNLIATQKIDLPMTIDYPWEDITERPDTKELERRDDWQQIFMPSGAFIAARNDMKHWLTFGSNASMPILLADAPLLMSDGSAEVVTRYGFWEKDQDSSKLSASAKSKKPQVLGWSSLPAGVTAKVRMSGLLWPEAAQRIVNSGYLTRETVGKGQVILFGNSPNFRGASLATNRLFLNALVYGPGMGTAPYVAL
ncbi:M14 family metallopeptidase [Pleionea litopenaei]|uniref:M14 family metallopeptidase n=1 Tax=Pleionea litopenaei TaxID=3070815 RepID=A0AA51RTB3_9GAMM|nr:M14 family metallopeptidase [Pleionea sp. HL-JVS1]WMS87210.1 M14 family metallopeptidase [Pleionea sp. HL-JVS1]